MSSARMLPETSMARMMVRSDSGSVILAVGRAVASSSAATASSSSSGGTWRRQPGPLPSASLATCTLASRTLLRLRRLSSHRYSTTSSGSATRVHNRLGQTKLMLPPPA